MTRDRSAAIVIAVNAQTSRETDAFEEAGTPDNRSTLRSQLLAMILAPGEHVDDLRRRALRSALRLWRSSVDPADVAVPIRTRRRPGVTRAEVAELAGLSLCWYTLLEAASAEHTCSPRAIERIADALRLEDVDRAILHTLASREAFRSFRILFAGDRELAA